MINNYTINRLKDIQDDLKVDSEYTGKAGQAYKLKRLGNYRKAIYTLRELDLFPKITEALYQSIIFKNLRSEEVDLSYTDDSYLKSLLGNLYTYIEGLISAYGADEATDNGDTLIFKYPDIRDFPELEKLSRDLNLAFQLPIHILSQKDNLKIQRIENGSIVLTVGFGSGLLLISRLINLGFKYKSKLEEVKRYQEYTRSLEIDNNLKENLGNAMTDQVKTFLQIQSEVLIKENISEDDNQKIEIVKNSVVIISDLLQKGLVVKTTINSPANVKDQIDETHQVFLGEQKKLEENNDK